MTMSQRVFALRDQKFPLVLVIAGLILSIGVGMALPLVWGQPVAMALGTAFLLSLGFVPLFFIKTKWIFLTILLLRPIIDTFRHFGIGSAERFATLNPAGILTAAIVVFTVFLVISKRLQFQELPVFWPAVILLLQTLTLTLVIQQRISVYFAADYLRLVSLPCIYVLSANVFPDASDLRQLIRVIYLSAVVPVAVAFYQLITGSGQLSVEGFTRVYGLFEAPGVLAMFLLIVFAFALVRIPDSSGMERRLLVAGSGIILVCIFFTYSRAAWVGVLIILGVIALFRRSWGLLLASVGLVLVLGIVVPHVSIRLLEATSLRDRSYLWWSTWQQLSWLDKLFGTGLGSWFDLALIGYGQRVEAHNDYLRIMVEIGVPFLGGGEFGGGGEDEIGD